MDSVPALPFLPIRINHLSKKSKNTSRLEQACVEHPVRGVKVEPPPSFNKM